MCKTNFIDEQEDLDKLKLTVSQMHVAQSSLKRLGKEKSSTNL